MAEKARRLMKQVGLEDDLGQRDVTQVSGGQLQRAGICRALMSDPKMIFGDEPTGALNSKSAQAIMDLFVRINSGGTAVMLVTHDAGIAAQAERVLFMRDGKIIDELRLPRHDKTSRGSRVEKVAMMMRAAGI